MNKILCKGCKIEKSPEFVDIDKSLCKACAIKTEQIEYFQPVTEKVTSTFNCYEDIIQNMVRTKFCTIPPQSCNNVSLKELNLPSDFSVIEQ